MHGMEKPKQDLSEINRELRIAAAQGNLVQVQNALAHGADPNAGNVYGETPLICSIKWRIKHHDYLSIIDELINAGADVNRADKKYNISPLCWAVSRHDLEVVRKLLEYGVLTEGALILSLQRQCNDISRELIMNGASIRWIFEYEKCGYSFFLKEVKNVFSEWSWRAISNKNSSYLTVDNSDDNFLYAAGQGYLTATTIFEKTILNDLLLRAIGYALRGGNADTLRILLREAKKRNVVDDVRLSRDLKVAARIYNALSATSTKKVIAELKNYQQIINVLSEELSSIIIPLIWEFNGSDLVVTWFCFLPAELIAMLILFYKPQKYENGISVIGEGWGNYL